MLTSKAFARSMRVMLFTPDASATEHLTKLLWTLPATGFVPHCRSADRLATVTPVIVDHVPDPLVHNDVLVNLCDVTPPFFSRSVDWWKLSGRTKKIAKPRACVTAFIATAVTTYAPIRSPHPCPDGRRKSAERR